MTNIMETQLHDENMCMNNSSTYLVIYDSENNHPNTCTVDT